MDIGKVPEYEEPEGLIRPKDGYIAAFLVPVLVMIIIFIQREIFPFGEESFLRTDMYHQYAPFFSEFQHKLTHGGSLLYSWDVGMGVNFAALYAYYLASPFNWLLILCPKNLIIEFMTYLIVIKIGLAGLSMTWYLRKHYRTESFGAAFFGIFYALSGYMAAYSWNIMWLDCIILFPLIMLGLERLVKEKQWGMYCICLGLSILSNYYISIMICIFMVIYFAVLLILEGWGRIREWPGSIGRFALSSLAAGGFAGVVLLPEVLALQSTASGSSTFPKTFTSYFSIIDMLARHIGNVEVEIGLDHWPNIYCGVAVLMFFLLYLACRSIPVREKTAYCGMLLFFFLSFSVNVLNFLWHGFHYPNSLPCRQSFIYILLLLSLCFHAYLHLKTIPWKHVVMAFWVSVAFVLIAEKTVTEKDFHFIVFYVAILFLALYTGLIYLYHRKWNRSVLLLLALGLVSLEAAVNTTATSVTTTSRSSYTKDNQEVRELLEESVPKNTFYRVEKMKRKTKNDGAWMNFPSVSLFSSVANADLSALFKQLGCESSTNAYSITGSTPLVNALFSVRYGLYSEVPSESALLTYRNESGNTYLYENAYTLPLGYLLPQNLEENFQPESGNPAQVQNQFAECLGCSPVLTDAWGDVNGQTFRFTPELDGDYYVYVINKSVKEVTVKRAEESQKFDHVNRGYFLELGFCPAGQEIVVTCEGDEILDARAYRFEENALAQVYEALQNGGMTVTGWQDTRIEGTVTAQEAGPFFTSIPYDEGWKVMVDGRELESRKIFDAFLGFDLTAGTHQISMEYTPPGLKAGAAISGVSIVLIGLAYLGCTLVKKGREEDRDEERDEEDGSGSEAEEAGADESMQMRSQEAAADESMQMRNQEAAADESMQMRSQEAAADESRTTSGKETAARAWKEPEPGKRPDRAWKAPNWGDGAWKKKESPEPDGEGWLDEDLDLEKILGENFSQDFGNGFGPSSGRAGNWEDEKF
ncbi:MAG: YfhO family protein [Lachnospiraceae bacterium]|nr:YfhO family protein [Lachnospiraceae bacterium]